MVLADQFGDGNVPAQTETLELAKGAFAALPAGATGPARAEMRRGSLSTDYSECFGDNQKQQGGLAQKVTLGRSISLSHYTGCIDFSAAAIEVTGSYLCPALPQVCLLLGTDIGGLGAPTLQGPQPCSPQPCS